MVAAPLGTGSGELCPRHFSDTMALCTLLKKVTTTDNGELLPHALIRGQCARKPRLGLKFPIPNWNRFALVISRGEK
jgi:hypothetical protein